jgi:hypothetical protein
MPQRQSAERAGFIDSQDNQTGVVILRRCEDLLKWRPNADKQLEAIFARRTHSVSPHERAQFFPRGFERLARNVTLRERVRDDMHENDLVATAYKIERRFECTL